MGRRKITDEASNSTDNEKNTEEREQLTQRMPKKIVTQVDSVSEELGISRNATVNMLVQQGLKNWESL